MPSEPDKSDHRELITGASVVAVLGMIGAVGKWGLDLYRARVIAQTESGRRALDDAIRLEGYAYTCRQLINENSYTAAQIAPWSQPEFFSFSRPGAAHDRLRGIDCARRKADS